MRAGGWGARWCAGLCALLFRAKKVALAEDFTHCAVKALNKESLFCELAARSKRQDLDTMAPEHQKMKPVAKPLLAKPVPRPVPASDLKAVLSPTSLPGWKRRSAGNLHKPRPRAAAKGASRRHNLRGGTAGKTRTQVPAGGDGLFYDGQQVPSWEDKAKFKEELKELDPLLVGDPLAIDSTLTSPSSEYYFQESGCCFHDEGDDDTREFDASATGENDDGGSLDETWNMAFPGMNGTKRLEATGKSASASSRMVYPSSVYDEIQHLSQKIKAEGAMIQEITHPATVSAALADLQQQQQQQHSPSAQYPSSVVSHISYQRGNQERLMKTTPNLHAPNGWTLLAAHGALLAIWVLVSIYKRRRVQSHQAPGKDDAWRTLGVDADDDGFELRGVGDGHDCSNGVYLLWNQTDVAKANRCDQISNQL
jgi:hypothetical protein